MVKLAVIWVTHAWVTWICAPPFIEASLNRQISLPQLLKRHLKYPLITVMPKISMQAWKNVVAPIPANGMAPLMQVYGLYFTTVVGAQPQLFCVKAHPGLPPACGRQCVHLAGSGLERGLPPIFTCHHSWAGSSLVSWAQRRRRNIYSSPSSVRNGARNNRNVVISSFGSLFTWQLPAREVANQTNVCFISYLRVQRRDQGSYTSLISE